MLPAGRLIFSVRTLQTLDVITGLACLAAAGYLASHHSFGLWFWSWVIGSVYSITMALTKGTAFVHRLSLKFFRIALFATTLK
jgi:hypothetical protein